MKFEEIYSGVVKRSSDHLIYYLLKGDVVVYVGMTTQGLTRPFSHNDKDFDKVIYREYSISKEELMLKENEMILKYRPIYNKNIDNLIYTNALIIRNIIRKKIDNEVYNLTNFKIDLLMINEDIFKLDNSSNYILTCKASIIIDEIVGAKLEATR